MDLSYIGENIKKRRKELGLTQAQIKELTGISTGNMSEIENGNSLPSCSALILLSKALQCSIDSLLVTEYSNSEFLNCSKNRDFSTLSENENILLASFNNLSESEKLDVLEYVQFKEFKSSRRGKRESDGTEKSFQSDHDSNGYGIA